MTVTPPGPAKRPDSRLSNLIHEGGRSQDYADSKRTKTFFRRAPRVIKRDNANRDEGSKK